MRGLQSLRRPFPLHPLAIPDASVLSLAAMAPLALLPTRFCFVVEVHEIQSWPGDSGPLVLTWQRGDRRRGVRAPLFVSSEEDGTVEVSWQFRVPCTLYRSGPRAPFQRKTLSLSVHRGGVEGEEAPLAWTSLDLAECVPAGLHVRNLVLQGVGGKPVVVMTVEMEGGGERAGKWVGQEGERGRGGERVRGEDSVREGKGGREGEGEGREEGRNWQEWGDLYGGDVSGERAAHGGRAEEHSAANSEVSPGLSPSDLHDPRHVEMARIAATHIYRSTEEPFSTNHYRPPDGLHPTPGPELTGVDFLNGRQETSLSPIRRRENGLLQRFPTWSSQGTERPSLSPPPVYPVDWQRQAEDERFELEEMRRRLQQVDEQLRLERQSLEEVKEKISQERGEIEDMALQVAAAIANAAAAEERARSVERAYLRLPAELQDTALAELAVHSIPATHGSSPHTLHMPARRMARAYWAVGREEGPERAAETSRAILRAIVMAVQSSSDNVSRLMYWWSNTVLLREAISRGPGAFTWQCTWSRNRSRGDGEREELDSSQSAGRAKGGEGRERKVEGADSFKEESSLWQTNDNDEASGNGEEREKRSSGVTGDQKVRRRGEGGNKDMGRLQKKENKGETVEHERGDSQEVRGNRSPRSRSKSPNGSYNVLTLSFASSEDDGKGWGMGGEGEEALKRFAFSLRMLEDGIYHEVVEILWTKIFLPLLYKPGGDSSGDLSPANSIGGKDAAQIGQPQKDNRIAGSEGGSAAQRWEAALEAAAREVCASRGRGGTCGCLPGLGLQVLAHCCLQLDACLFNAALHRAEDEAEPPLDPLALLLPTGPLSAAHGMHIKMAISAWSDVMANISEKATVRPPSLSPLGSPNSRQLPFPDTVSFRHGDRELPPGAQEDNTTTPITNLFPYLRAMADLLMLPKALLSDQSFRKEVCGPLSLPLVRRIIYRFAPDGQEAGNDYVSPALLAAINAEVRMTAGPIRAGPPVSVYVAPSPASVWRHMGPGREVDEGEECEGDLKSLESSLEALTPTSTVTIITSPPNRPLISHKPPKPWRYTLLGEMWSASKSSETPRDEREITPEIH